MAVQGIFANCGVGLETTWGTGVTVNCAVPLLSEDHQRTHEVDLPDILRQSPYKRFYSIGNQMATGKITAIGVIDRSGVTDFVGIEPLILAALGYGSRDATNNTNRYLMTNQLAKYLTVAVRRDDDDNFAELQGGKVSKLSISGSASTNRVQMDVELIGKKILYTGETGIVNDAVPDWLNYTPLRFTDLTVLLGDTADALGAGDEIKINEFTIDIENNLTEPEFASGDEFTLEPIENGFKSVNVKFTIPRGTSTQFLDVFTKLKNGTKMQAQLTFTTGTYWFKIFLPLLIYSESPKQSIDSPNVVPLEINLTALQNSSAINGNMKFADGTTVVRDLIGFEVKSDRTAIPS